MGLETPVRALGLSPGADRGRGRGDGRTATGERADDRSPTSSPAASSATASRSSRCSRRSRRPPTSACGWWSRPRSSASRCGAAEDAAERDPRIELRLADQPTAEHLREVASCDVCLAPARWEGLGLPLYEAIAFGMPAITNDAPPMNEAIHDGVNGLLVGSTRERNGEVRDPGARPRRRRPAARDRAARRRRAARRARRRRACACATASAAGTTPWPGSAQLLTTAPNG